MTTLIGCPECHAPAEIIDRFTLPSTDGPIEHVDVCCCAGHFFRMPEDMLTRSTVDASRESAPAVH